jgi:hypothetical protein
LLADCSNLETNADTTMDTKQLNMCHREERSLRRSDLPLNLLNLQEDCGRTRFGLHHEEIARGYQKCH